MDREKFLEDIYKSSEEGLKEVYKEQEENKENILKEIAMILLTYTIVDNVLSLNKKEKDSCYNKLSKLILSMFGAEIKNSTETINNILIDAAEKNFKYYGLKDNKRFIEKLVNEHYRGLKFSDRVWNNGNDVSKILHKEIKDFLDGKINANQIKSHIEKRFDVNKYNVKRLVNTEIARIESKVTENYFKEYGIKKVRYNACLCNTCDKCMSDHNKVFNVDDSNRPSLPRHPNCQCFYVQEDDEKTLVMNLQLFGINERKELQKLIDNGVINKVNYDKCYKYFNEQFRNGVTTPIEIVYNDKDRFIHIARRHTNMISKKQIDNIIDSLRNPNEIYKTIDKFGIEGKGYVKNIDGNQLLTIVRNGIITSYYPSESYINKVKRGELIWAKR
ncbi:minor capsid protein [Clostridium paraputrificum]|uniref:minor capsid protein n=1 Tax=Clostridium paraputrificum TaxID=29363 RepID=UPI0006C62569|nr:minor capsid protein [Clostridium paraputrificum]CUO15063.1 NAD:arginine ADP-ribosyltransferase ART [Clostridium paraputrificum]